MMSDGRKLPEDDSSRATTHGLVPDEDDAILAARDIFAKELETYVDERLTNDDIPADPLGDFANTTGNSLSVWLVDEDKTNFSRVVTAMAANRERVDKFDYVLFREELLDTVGIKVAESKGDTPDAEANEFHRNLVELSASKVVALTKNVFENRLEIGRVDKATLEESIVKAVRERQIPVARLNRKLRSTVEALLKRDDDEEEEAELARKPK